MKYAEYDIDREQAENFLIHAVHILRSWVTMKTLCKLLLIVVAKHKELDEVLTGDSG